MLVDKEIVELNAWKDVFAQSIIRVIIWFLPYIGRKQKNRYTCSYIHIYAEMYYNHEGYCSIRGFRHRVDIVNTRKIIIDSE